MTSVWLKTVRCLHINLSHKLLELSSTVIVKSRVLSTDVAAEKCILFSELKTKCLAFISSSPASSALHSWQRRSIHQCHNCCGFHVLEKVNIWVERVNCKWLPKKCATSMTNTEVFVTHTLQSSLSSQMQVRYKSKKKQDDNASDSEEEDDILEDDDFDAPPKYKIMNISIASMRADAVVSHGLDIGRNRLEEEFLSSGLLVNGKKVLKKAIKMEEGDYADIIVEKMDNQLKVKRVKVLKIYPEKTSKDKFIVKVRVWKSPFLIENPNAFVKS